MTDLVAEAARIADRARDSGPTMRVAGGVAIALLCPSARQPPLAREYQDVDFVTRKDQVKAVDTLLAQLGYVRDRDPAALYDPERLHFRHRETDVAVDLFVDRIRGCHELDLRRRLDTDGTTLMPIDLALSKLQIIETNTKDYRDIVALFRDCELTDGEPTGIDVRYAVDLCRSHWGLWRTVTIVAERAQQFARELGGDFSAAAERLATFRGALDAGPKSRQWKLRARIGDRVRWYELPEEIEHDA